MRLMLFLMLLLTLPAKAENYRTLQGAEIQIPQQGWAHLVFIDLWQSYSGEGPERVLVQLPTEVREKMFRLWVQPRLNLMEADLQGYQQAFPTSTPLVLDEQFSLMRRYRVWQLPVHVLLRDGEKVFAGSDAELIEFIDSQQQAGTL